MALDREAVVREALRLLDEVGLEGLTLRWLAGELAVKAPALYWHFKNKQELLDEMATTMLRDLVMETTAPGEPWEKFVVGSGRSSLPGYSQTPAFPCARRCAPTLLSTPTR